MEETIQTKWLGKMAFESTIGDFTFQMDADEKTGGQHLGPRPKPLLLSALAGCTGMDVISILEKKRVFPTSFEISVSGIQTEEHPKYYKSIHIIYTFTGESFQGNEDVLTKATRSVQLSQENYCGVSAMLKQASSITYEIVLKNS